MSQVVLIVFHGRVFFTFTRFDRAKKIWLTIGAITLMLALLRLFFGLLPLIITGYSVYTISILVMAVGILVKI